MTSTSLLIIVSLCVLVLASLIWAGGIAGQFVRARRTQQPTEAAPAVPIDAAPTDQRLPYARTPHLLTPAEQAFFAVLQSVVPPGLVVYPQMRLASIVHVEEGARSNHTHFNRIQAKCVDFVLCETQTTAPRLVIELDDSSHQRRHRQERDAFVDQVLASAGVPILHVRWQRQYNAQDLARNVQMLLGTHTPATSTTLTTP